MSNLVLIAEDGVNQPDMFHRFNVSNMKINHGSRQTNMTETLLHIQKTLAILKQVACCTVTQGVNSDRTIEAGLCQGILHNGAYISRLDRLRGYSFAMRLENEVITWEPLLEDAQQD